MLSISNKSIEIFLKLFFISFCFIIFFNVSVNTARAVDNVRIISDVSAIGKSNGIALKAIQGFQSVITGLTNSLKIKEYLRDPLQSQISAQAFQKSVAEVVKQVNGGDSGSPAYVENYSDYFDQVANGVFTDIVFGNTYDDLDDRVAFEIKNSQLDFYINTYQSKKLQSSEDSKTEEEVYPLTKVVSTFTQCENDPICQKLEADVMLYTRIGTAQQNEGEYALRDHGGFKPKYYCRNKENGEGDIEPDCMIVNPPGSLSTASNYVFGELPITAPLTADEYGETISSYITELANQTFNSPIGSLLLGGNTEFSADVFGEGGTLSYVDALVADKPNKNITDLVNPILDAYDAELEYQRLQNIVLDDIILIENVIASSTEKFPNCFDIELGDELTGIKSTTTLNLEISSTTQTILSVLNDQWNQADDPVIKNSILDVYTDYENQGYFRTREENYDFELGFINIELKFITDPLKIDIDRAREDCGGEKIFNIGSDGEEGSQSG